MLMPPRFSSDRLRCYNDVPMLTTFIVLAALSLATTLGAALLLLLTWGRPPVKAGPRREHIVSGRRSRRPDRQQPRSRYLEVSGSYAEVKQLVRSGEWRRALPALVAIFSLLATALFTALALYTGLDDRLFGGFVLAIALIAIVAILIGFVRA